MSTPESTQPPAQPVESAAPAAPSVASPAAPGPAPLPSPQGVSLLTVLAIAIFCSAVSGYAAWRSASRAESAAQVVVFDASKVVNARMDKAIGAGELSEGDAAAAGKKFVSDLNTELDRYTQAGIVVINSSVTLNHPPALDITADVAASLGVKLK